MTFHSDLWSLELLGSSPACLRQLLHGFLLYLVDAGAAFSVEASSTPSSWISTMSSGRWCRCGRRRYAFGSSFTPSCFIYWLSELL
jgi:hypothetical protein